MQALKLKPREYYESRIAIDPATKAPVASPIEVELLQVELLLDIRDIACATILAVGGAKQAGMVSDGGVALPGR